MKIVLEDFSLLFCISNWFYSVLLLLVGNSFLVFFLEKRATTKWKTNPELSVAFHPQKSRTTHGRTCGGATSRCYDGGESATVTWLCCCLSEVFHSCDFLLLCRRAASREKRRFDDVSVVIRVKKSYFFPYNFLLFRARLSLSDERIRSQKFSFCGGGWRERELKCHEMRPATSATLKCDTLCCHDMKLKFPLDFSLSVHYFDERSRRNVKIAEMEMSLNGTCSHFHFWRRDAMNYWRTAVEDSSAFIVERNKIVFIIE